VYPSGRKLGFGRAGRKDRMRFHDFVFFFFFLFFFFNFDQYEEGNKKYTNFFLEKQQAEKSRRTAHA
jgi:hypothetical protein